MANFEVLSLDPTTPQIRAPGAGDGYSVPRDMTFATGTTLNAPTTVVSVNTSTDALRITQVGAGNALVVEDSANPDATPTVITATGNVGIGTASPSYKLHVENNAASTTNAAVINTSASSGAYTQFRAQGDAGAGYFGYAGSGNSAAGVFDADCVYLASENTAAALCIGASGASAPIRFFAGGSSAASERMRITSAGELLAGTTTALSWEGVTGGAVQSAKTTFNPVVSSTFAASTAYPLFVLAKSRSGTVGTYTYPNSGDRLGTLSFAGANTTDAAFNSGALIEGVANQTWTSTAQGTYLRFFTTADGAKGTTERMRLTSAGEVLVGGTTEINMTGWPGIGSNPAHATFQSTVGGYLILYRNDVSIASGDYFGAVGFYGNDTTSNTPTLHASVNAIASGTHAAGDNPTDVVIFTTPNNTETIAEAGRITESGSYVLKGGTTAPGGVGIVFPATQVASADANSLDDYEEGAWTPVVADAATGGNASATVCVGSYTKVGRVVTATCAAPNIDTTGLTAGNDVFIRGLPFTAFDIPSATTFYTGVAFTSQVTIVAPPVVYVQDTTTYAKLFDSGAILVSDINSGLGDIYFTITYQTA